MMKKPWICKFDQADNGADDEFCNVCDRPRSIAEKIDELVRNENQPNQGREANSRKRIGHFPESERRERKQDDQSWRIEHEQLRYVVLIVIIGLVAFIAGRITQSDIPSQMLEANIFPSEAIRLIDTPVYPMTQVSSETPVPSATPMPIPTSSPSVTPEPIITPTETIISPATPSRSST